MVVDPLAQTGVAGGFAAAAPGHRRSGPAIDRQVIGFLKQQVPPGGLVLDVGAGTGVLTGQLHRAGLSVVAVERHADGIRQLGLALPSVPVLSARSDALAVCDACIDLLVVSGERDAELSWDEARRVLRPGATLAVVRPAEVLTWTRS